MQIRIKLSRAKKKKIENHYLSIRFQHMTIWNFNYSPKITFWMRACLGSERNKHETNVLFPCTEIPVFHSVKEVSIEIVGGYWSRCMATDSSWTKIAVAFKPILVTFRERVPLRAFLFGAFGIISPHSLNILRFAASAHPAIKAWFVLKITDNALFLKRFF